MDLFININCDASKSVSGVEELGERMAERREECAVDQLKRFLCGFINEKQTGVAEEAKTERSSSSVCWRVTCSDEENILKTGPFLSERRPESASFDELTEERDHSLCAVFVA